MKFFGSIAISKMGLMGAIKSSKIYSFFVYSYLCRPTLSSIFNPLKLSNPFKSVNVRSFAVGSILSICGFTQIFNSIVCLISVNMIYLIFAINSLGVDPSKSMSGIIFAIYLYINIPFLFMNVASNFSYPISFEGFYPLESPRLGGVFKDLSERGLVHTSLCHDRNGISMGKIDV